MKASNEYVNKISQYIVLLSVILVFCIVTVSCNKKTMPASADTVQSEYDEDTYNENDIRVIDFDRMEQIVANAKTIDVEVFFAISVLHSRYIKSFAQEAALLSDDRREKFYTDKKNEFFKNSKFSESQYNDFMQKHAVDLNNYINQYPEITQYLTTDN